MRLRSRADAAFERFRAGGEPRHLARLFDLTAGELGRVARWLAGDRHEAEDLVQATFLTVIERARDCAPGRPVLPWMLGILANRARHGHRDRARRPDGRALQTRAAEDPVAAAEGDELAARLERCLAELPPPYREVLVLHLRHGLSAREVGAALGRPAGTVRTQLVRGMERLRRALPAGLAGLAWSAGGGGLALGRVRELVCARAAARFSASTSGGALAVQHGLLAAIGGTMAAKSIGLAGLVLAGVAWIFWPDGGRGAAPARPEAGGAAGAALAGGEPRSARARVEAPPVEGSASAVEEAARAPMLLVRVRHASDGAPAAGVALRLAPEPPPGTPVLHERERVTDARGEARVDDLAAGEWSVRSDRGDRGALVMLAPRESATLDLEVPAGIEVRGRVVDAHSVPVAGAQIWLSSSPDAAKAGGVVAHSAAGGRFVLRDVPRGRYLAAFAAGHHASACVVVRGAVGEVCQVELVVPAGGATLSGRVVDAAGAPVPHAALLAGHPWAEPPYESGPPARNARADEQGRFDFHGLPRDARAAPLPVWARAAGYATLRREIALDGPRVEVELVLPRGATVRGRVTDTSGAPQASIQVGGLHEDFRSPQHHRYAGPLWTLQGATTDAHGEYELRELPPGRVRMGAQRDERVASVELELVEGEEREWHPVLLEASAAPAIVGTVVDPEGRALPGYDVWAEGPADAVRRPRRARTAEDGAFRLAPCDGAEHVVRARHARSAMHGHDVRVAGVRPGAGPITLVVPEARRASATLTGIVRDAQGRALLDEELWVALDHLAPGGRLDGAEVSRFEGERFFAEPLVPGRYEVRVGLYDGSLVSRVGTLEFAPGQTHDLGEIALPAPGFVELEVADATGEPLAKGDFLIHEPGSRYGQIVTVHGGRGASKGLVPGTYAIEGWSPGLPLLRLDVELRSGERSIARIALPPAYPRSVRYPTLAAGEELELVWRDAGGRVLRSGRGNWTGPTGSEHELVLAAGRYEVEVARPGGAALRMSFVVDARERSEQVIELPVPGG